MVSQLHFLGKLIDIFERIIIFNPTTTTNSRLDYPVPSQHGLVQYQANMAWYSNSTGNDYEWDSF